MTFKTKYIVLVGPDGSGKTTVADSLSVSFLEQGIQNSRMNFSFGILPSVSDLLRKEKDAPPPEGLKNSGMVEPLTAKHASLLAIWYGIDHIAGHWTLRKKGKGSIVIFARSYHDFLYQRAYLNLPKGIARFFIALGPKPDLIACPLREAREINSQKPELTVDEIKVQYKRIIKRLEKYPYFQQIDASAGIADTVSTIIRNLES